MPAANLRDLLIDARTRLAGTPFEVSPREAVLLLAHVLGLSEAGVIARQRDAADDHLDEAARRRFEALLERRLAGEPFAYLTGEREFYGRAFAVDRRVLVPRPETEHLVDAVLALDLPERPRILDVGAGSGAIAVTLAAELPGGRVTASDLSWGALMVTRKNARRHGVTERFRTVLADAADAFRLDAFDLVASNPPYIDPAVAPELSPEVVEHEPHLALFAADAGRAMITRLVDAATALRPGVAFLLEIGHDQAAWLRDAIAERPHLRLETFVRDYGGILRTAVLRRV